MNNLNSLLIEGELDRDPLYRETRTGKPVCTFNIVSRRFFRPDADSLEPEDSSFEVQVWGKLAETVSDKGHAGRKVRVVGRLKEDRWEGADGKHHSKVFIVAEHVEFRPEPAKPDAPKKRGRSSTAGDK